MTAGVERTRESGARSARASGTAVAVLILVLAAAVRLHGLARDSLWLDEVTSVALARSDSWTFLNVVASSEFNSILYFVLLRPFVAFSTDEAVARALSAVCGIATVAVTGLLGRRLFGPLAGGVAAALLAVNAGHVHYSQEARGYSLAVLLVTVSTLLFVDATERPTRTRWAAYVLVSGAAGYAHFFAVLVPLAHWISLAARPKRRLPRGFAAAVLATLALWLPIAVFVLFKDKGQVSWISPPSLEVVRGTFVLLAGGTPALLWAQLLAGLAVVALRRRKREREASPLGWAVALCTAWFVLPAALALAIAPLKPLFVPRYLLVSLPALPLLAAAGIASLRPPALAAAALAVLVALAVPPLVRGAGPAREDWRGATSFLLRNASSGDAVVFHPRWSRRPFDHYRERTPVTPDLTGFPPWWDYASFVRGKRPSRVDPLVVARLNCSHPRIWLMARRSESLEQTEGRALRAALGAAYAERTDFVFTGVTLFRYGRPRPCTAADSEANHARRDFAA